MASTPASLDRHSDVSARYEPILYAEAGPEREERSAWFTLPCGNGDRHENQTNDAAVRSASGAASAYASTG
jgi:hypothetical protein